MKYFILNLFFIIGINGITQEVIIQWQSCFGGSDFEDAGFFDDCIASLPDGYLIVSETKSIDGDVQSNSFEQHNIWVFKTDFHGNLIWEKTIGGSDGSGVYTLTKYNDTTFYIFGVTGSTDGDVQSGNQGLADNWVVKINEKGDILWEKTFGGELNDKYGSLQVTEIGDILVFSETWSKTGDFGINDLPGDLHLWFYKIDQYTGEILWSELYGGEGRNRFGDFLQTEDGGYLLVGTCAGYEGAGCVCEHNNPGLWYNDFWVIKLDKDRNIEWQDCYGGSENDQSFNVIEEDFGYTLVGVSHSSDGDVGYNFNDGDIWFLQIDKVGDILNSKVYGGGDYESPDALFKDSQTGGYTIIGKTRSNNGDISGNHCYDNGECYFDIWYVVLDSLGNIQYQKCIGNQGDQEPGGVLKIDDGHFIISATSNWSDADDVECPRPYPYSEDDIWLFEIRDCDLYPPTIPSQPIGQDTICTLSYSKSIYTTQITKPQYEEGEWLLEPLEAGGLINKNDTVLIHWNTDYEGQVALSVRSTSSCGESEYSEPKQIVVRACVGIDEINKKSLFLYPNPATNQITFELPNINKQSQIQIKDIYGKLITTLIIKPNQSKLVWECGAFASGVYFYEGEIGGEVYRGKFLIE